jgi:hypothetical protein
MASHRLLVLATTLAMVTWPVGIGFARQTTEGVAISKPAKRALNQRYKHWQLAAVDPAAGSCAANGAGAKAFVQGDLDGDGRADVALALKTDQGVRLVVLLARVQDVALFDVDALGDAQSNVFLGMEHRAAPFSKQTGLVREYFSTDSVTTFHCGQVMTAYLWNGAGFLKTPLSPVSGPGGPGRR